MRRSELQVGMPLARFRLYDGRWSKTPEFSYEEVTVLSIEPHRESRGFHGTISQCKRGNGVLVKCHEDRDVVQLSKLMPLTDAVAMQRHYDKQREEYDKVSNASEKDRKERSKRLAQLFRNAGMRDLHPMPTVDTFDKVTMRADHLEALLRHTIETRR